MIITIVNSNRPTQVYRDVIERNGAKTRAEKNAEFQQALEAKAAEQAGVTGKSGSATANAGSTTANAGSAGVNSSGVNGLTGLGDSSLKGLVNSLKPIEVPDELLPIFKEAAATYGVDEGILIAMAKQESNFRTDAVSSAGAVGVMQLMPKTAEGLGVTNSYDARENIMGGAKLLSQELAAYNGNVSLALAAYSAGGGAVKKYDGIPPYKETQNHIPRVLLNYARGYKAASSDQVVLPDSNKLAETVVAYKGTKGSAFSEGVEVTDRQREDLQKLLLMAMEGIK